MDVSRVLYSLAKVYVLALVVVSIVTFAWILEVFEQASVWVAGIWFAIAAFGVLVFITFLLVHLSRT